MEVPLGGVDLSLDFVVVELDVESVVRPPEPDGVGLGPGEAPPPRPGGVGGAAFWRWIVLVDAEKEGLACRRVEGPGVGHEHGQDIQLLKERKERNENACLAFLRFSKSLLFREINSLFSKKGERKKGWCNRPGRLVYTYGTQLW